MSWPDAIFASILIVSICGWTPIEITIINKPKEDKNE